MFCERSVFSFDRKEEELIFEAIVGAVEENALKVEVDVELEEEEEEEEEEEFKFEGEKEEGEFKFEGRERGISEEDDKRRSSSK